MRLFDTIGSWKECGMLPSLIKLGIVSSTTNEYYLITARYYQLSARRKFTSKTILMNDLSTELKTSTNTIYKAIRLMESELTILR